MNKKILILISILLVLGVAYWLISPFWNNVILHEELPSNPDANINVEATPGDGTISAEEAKPTSDTTIILSETTMVAEAHEVEGSALLVQTGDETFLRFENLKTINGPDLRIYLSSNLNVKDSIDLGAIRATEGDVNYPVPAGTDLSKYKNALIWCRAFGVLFSYAEL